MALSPISALKLLVTREHALKIIHVTSLRRYGEQKLFRYWERLQFEHQAVWLCIGHSGL